MSFFPTFLGGQDILHYFPYTKDEGRVPMLYTCGPYISYRQRIRVLICAEGLCFSAFKGLRRFGRVEMPPPGQPGSLCCTVV